MSLPLSAFLPSLVAAAFFSQSAFCENIPVVQKVDLNRYLGLWYEIARLPNEFQNQCIANTTASYSLLEDKRIKVVNRCKTKDGSYSEAEGVAKKANDNSDAKLKVRFAPAWLSWLSSVWGDYWILDLADDYSYALIGEPSLNYLWVLSRTKTLDEKTYSRLMQLAEKLGYNVKKVIKTTQE